MRNKHLFIFMFFLFLIGCSATKKSLKEKQILSYSIVLGYGGGFTGWYKGKEIDTNGMVFNWEGRSYSTSTKEIIDTLTQKQILKLNEYLNKNNFSEYSLKESGNTIGFLTLSNIKGKISFSWKDSTTPAHAPKEIQELIFFISDILSNHKQREE